MTRVLTWRARPVGRHKLFPSVSPKKSWEGFVGGLIAAVVATGLLLGWEQCYIGCHHLYRRYVG